MSDTPAGERTARDSRPADVLAACDTPEQLRDAARKHALLFEAMRALTSTLVLEDVLELAARTAGEVMGVFAADINVYSPEDNTMTEVAYWALKITPEDTAYTGSSISLDARPDYYPHLDDPVLVERQLDDPCFPDEEREIAAHWGEQSGLVAPLMYGGRLIGLMGCIEKRWKRCFTQEDKELFRLLTVPAALAIHNARMYQREEVRNRGLVNLLSAARRVAGALSSEDVALSVKQEVAGLFPARTCGVDVVFLEQDQGGRAAAVKDELVAAAVAGGRPAYSAAGPPRMVTPLASRDATVAYVDIRDAGRKPFSVDECELIEILVTQAETALENARLYGELERQAITDGLTGLYNRRYFYVRLSQEIARAERLGTSFTLLLCDLDDFKSINDRYGHQTGDDVLRGVAGALSRGVRAGLDLMARYGGEEFVVILPSEGAEGQGPAGADEGPTVAGAQEDVSAAIAERIRSEIESTTFISRDGRHSIGLTVSAGTAVYPRDASDTEGLVLAADRALYRAKRRGKNRVVAFS